MSTHGIALVLGSGGARGLAHIGVIRCLVERGFTIDYISGCSMGALIGGIYAAGELETYADWVQALDRGDVLKLLDWSFSRGALFKGERIVEVLRNLIGDADIADLDIGFTAVATDLNGPREVWLNKGSLWDAVRASMAVPLVFAPVERDGRLLVDGGLLNPVPIAPTFNSGASMTVAVDLNAPRRWEHGAAGAERAGGGAPARGVAAAGDADDGGARRQLDTVGRQIAGFFTGFVSGGPEAPEGPSAYEVALRSMDAMQSTISRIKLAAYSPELVIDVPRGIASFFEFYRARELIEYGYRRTGEALDRGSGA